MNEVFLVTDTHPLLWYLEGPKRKLSKKALKAFESAEHGMGTHIYVPMPAVWEISLLLRKTNRITTKVSFEELVLNNFFFKSSSIADLLIEDITLAHSLTFMNDPFDALIVATAQRMELPLITADGVITNAKPCKIVWD
jgi:PIN domain nuclease of toxin-antitoxin system